MRSFIICNLRQMKLERRHGQGTQHAWDRRRMHTGLLVGNAEGTRPLGRPRRKWNDNIRLDLKEKV
jgi:hypothetical protein